VFASVKKLNDFLEGACLDGGLRNTKKLLVNVLGADDKTFTAHFETKSCLKWLIAQHSSYENEKIHWQNEVNEGVRQLRALAAHEFNYRTRQLLAMGIDDVDLLLSDSDDEETADGEHAYVKDVRRELETAKARLEETTDLLRECGKELLRVEPDKAKHQHIAPPKLQVPDHVEYSFGQMTYLELFEEIEKKMKLSVIPDKPQITTPHSPLRALQLDVGSSYFPRLWSDRKTVVSSCPDICNLNWGPGIVVKELYPFAIGWRPQVLGSICLTVNGQVLCRMEDDTVTITQVCPDKNIVKVFISTNHVDKHCLHFSIGVIDDGGRAYIVEIQRYTWIRHGEPKYVLIPISDYMTKQTDIDKMKNRRADLEKTKLGCETICYDIERHLRLLGVNDVDLCLSDCDDQETDDEEYDSVMFLRRSLQTNKVLLKEATDLLLDCEREFDEAEDMFIAPCDITSMSLTGSESRSATIMVSSTEKVVLLNYRAGMPAPLSKLSRLKCTIFRGATKAISVACDLGVAFCIDIHGNLRSRQFPPHGDLGAGLGRTVTPACPADEFHEVTLGVHGIGKICKAISSNRDYALALSESGDVWE